MTRIRVLPYGPSNSARDLANAITERRRGGPAASRIPLTGSQFRGREGDVVINWGNSTFADDRVLGRARILNSPAAIGQASNKINAFALMYGANVPCVEHTTDRDTAQRWFESGALVYARTRLSGHSGEGIVMASQTMDADSPAFRVERTLPQARLYTKGITEQRREFRIHVMNGQVTYVQQKKRADDYRNNPSYSNLVRNYHTGWIYATSDVQPNAAALSAARAAVRALGLDFGAVDVITRHDSAWVLEVNTAPGLQGTNLETYANNFVAIIEGRDVAVWRPTDVTIPDDGTAAAAAANIEARRAETAQRLEAEQQLMQAAAERPTPRMRQDAAQHPSNRYRATAQEAQQTTRETQQRTEQVAQRASPAAADAPVHEAYYAATLNGTRLIVQYNQEVRGFYMAGWEIPLTNGRDGFVVGDRINF